MGDCHLGAHAISVRVQRRGECGNSEPPGSDRHDPSTNGQAGSPSLKGDCFVDLEPKEQSNGSLASADIWIMSTFGLLSLPQRLLPMLEWIPLYERQWLLPDFLAGAALWAVMVPEGMAYAGNVGVPPISCTQSCRRCSPMQCSERRVSLSSAGILRLV